MTHRFDIDVNQTASLTTTICAPYTCICVTVCAYVGFQCKQYRLPWVN